MNKNKYTYLVFIFLISTVLACASKTNKLQDVQVMDGSKTPVRLEAGTIEQDTVWKGTIKIKGVVKVAKGVTLTIVPGTKVAFAWLDTDADGIGDSGLLVNGSMIAKGTGHKPILFTSTARSKPGAWGEVKLEDASPSHFRYCYFTFAYWGLHMHFSPVAVEYCRFEYSEGGLRFRSGPININHNLIQENKIAIRYIHSNPTIKRNTIRRNHTGIFIREGSKHPVINENDIYENKGYSLKLGEAQAQDINCPQNFWGTTDTSMIDKKIFDYKDSDYIGRVNYQPVADKPWGMIWNQ